MNEKKVEHGVKPLQEIKWLFVNQQCAFYVSHAISLMMIKTWPNVFAKHKTFAFGKHFNDTVTKILWVRNSHFRKYHAFDCLVLELMFMKCLRPTLNKHSDSIESMLLV